ncbi:hypothetical protein EF87_21045 [Bacillus amyloliquefaciens]|nr:hypothetical protein EF87_21045 [Bacillus amyloliquefaciens]
MKTCPYCGSLVAKEEQAHYYECDFCMIQINVTEEDGSRRTIPFRETADEEDIFKTFLVLLGEPISISQSKGHKGLRAVKGCSVALYGSLRPIYL